MQSLLNRTDAITGKALDPELLTDLYKRKRGGMPIITTRVYVTDTVFTKLDMVDSKVADRVWKTTGLPSDKADVSPLLQASSIQITHDSTQAVHRSIQMVSVEPSLFGPGVFDLAETPWNPYQHLLRVSEVHIWPDVGVACEVFQGYFWMGMPKRQLQLGQIVNTWNGLSLCGRVARCNFFSDYAVPLNYVGSTAAGVNGYVGAVIDMLMVGGKPLSLGGTGFCPADGNDDAGPGARREQIKLSAANNRATPYDQLYSMGASRIGAINDQLKACMMFDLWDDENGNFRSDPIPDPSGPPPPISWDYSTLPEDSIVTSDGFQQEFDSLNNGDISNVAHVLSAPSGVAAINAVGANDDAGSVVSQVNFKGLDGGPGALPVTIRNDAIPDQATANAVLADALMQGNNTAVKMTFNTQAVPFHQDYEILTCQVVDRNGTVRVISDADHPFVEIGWTLTLGPDGTQSHTILSVAPLG